MPLYLDTHEHVAGLTAAAVASAHAADLAVQEKHGMKFLRYWFDETTGKVYCLAEGPSPDALRAAHREAHGLIPDLVVEVTEGF